MSSERSWSTEIKAEFGKQQVSPFTLVELLFDAGPLRLHDGVGDLAWNGETWTGAGEAGAISVIRESTELRANGVSLTVTGVDSQIIAIALDHPYQGRPVKIYLGFFDDAGAIITAPVAVFSGRMDTMTIRDEGRTATVVVQCESRLIDLERPRERRYTTEDQAIDYAGDLGFEFVESLQDASVVWGRS